MRLSENLQYQKGIGPKIAEFLAEKRLFTVADLLHYFPRKHIDLSSTSFIQNLKEDEMVTIAGTITRVNSIMHANKEQVGAYLHDGTGGIELKWFNTKNMREILLKRGSGIFSGKVSKYQGKKQIINPLCQFDGESGTTAGGVLPVYKNIGNLSQSKIRQYIRRFLDECKFELEDHLAPNLKELDLLKISDAMEKIHFPKDEQEYDEARKRFVLEEFIFFQTALQLKRKENLLSNSNNIIKITEKIDASIRSRIPFTLTQSQDQVISEIKNDLSRSHSMNRLLQGDVGSGKTIIAFYFLLSLVALKHQTAFIAPTEVLAQQHYAKIKDYLKGSSVEVVFISGSLKSTERESIAHKVKSNTAKIIIGTHAIFSDDIVFHDLKGIVIDEQHRFGVMQRAKIKTKGDSPHTLVMTATPIPRTLSMSIFGDLDLSIIKGLPPGRSPIRTFLINESQRKKAYTSIKSQINKGHQAIIICPVIDENENHSFQSAIELYESLKISIFKDFTLSLMHGRLKAQEKNIIMEDFHQGKTDLLISTQVIEVGVDNPNATIILIDSAERFGLAQLHQLRGRVGRGQFNSTCLLMSDKTEGPTYDRLKCLETMQDGFQIAEEDLEMRGSGDFFGFRQSGLPEFKIGHPQNDYDLMIEAKSYAIKLLENQNDDSKKLIQKVLSKYKNRFNLSDTA